MTYMHNANIQCWISVSAMISLSIILIRHTEKHTHRSTSIYVDFEIMGPQNLQNHQNFHFKNFKKYSKTQIYPYTLHTTKQYFLHHVWVKEINKYGKILSLRNKTMRNMLDA